MTEQTIIFEKDGYTCEAVVEYTQPQNKWLSDSDRDYEGGVEVAEMTVYDAEGVVDNHTVTWEDVIRHYEVLMETTQVEYQLSSMEDPCDSAFWED